MPHRAVLALAGACVLVVVTAVPGASDDESVTWEQVRTALAVARADRPGEDRPPAPEPTAAPEPSPAAAAAAGTATMVLTVTIPDLSWALDDPTAADGVRRAACHQATRTDDEAAAPLAACLRHVRGLEGD